MAFDVLLRKYIPTDLFNIDQGVPRMRLDVLHLSSSVYRILPLTVHLSYSCSTNGMSYVPLQRRIVPGSSPDVLDTISIATHRFYSTFSLRLVRLYFHTHQDPV